MIIREETKDDIAGISQVTLAAFTGKFSDNPTEHLIILGLREANALTLSLVAETNGNIVGHVAFSAVTINGEDKGWYGLGPISVQPENQRQGIGSALIKDGLSKLRDMGAKGCVLEGDPNYYQRFGFKSYAGLFYENSPGPEYFMALPFYEEVPQGRVEFHDAFYVQAD
ncbi:MAG TPA: N-acetyltransferase [Anaerolineales bacterium]|nr:N-acetyltransferase [Anaerolineales bacterium]